MLKGLDKSQKGQKIYNMWREKRSDFEKYATGDVVDVLTLFEELYERRQVVASVRTS